jgi:hypothetical protein
MYKINQIPHALKGRSGLHNFWGACVVSGAFMLCLTSEMSSAHAIGFADAFDPSNWTLSTNNGNGTVNTSGAPSSISIVSANNGSGSTSTDYTIPIPVGVQNLSFAWDFSTVDVDGPSFDPFGYLINGSYIQLTDSFGNNSQSGVKSVNVTLGDVFGFRALATDSVLGASTTQIFNFTDSPNPQPVSLQL